MGIDLHNLNFLAHARNLGVSFERTLAIGRQALFVEPRPLEDLRQRLGLPPLVEPALPPGAPRYFEPLLQQWLGAQVTDSVDASAYEHAPLIHDMNLPWPQGGAMAEVRASYDAVLDFGCLEHVFDFPTAWRNCIDLCKVGGHVLHALPANNLSGHGFYQFSPELFCNLYQPSRGFELRGLFFVLKAEPRLWWRVANPLQVRRRVNLCNSHEVYLLVLARKLAEPGVLPAPQQSDYAQDEWLKPAPAPGAAFAAAPAPVAALAAAGASNAGASPSTTVPASPGARQRVLDLLATFGLRDSARALREQWRAVRHSGLDLPAPDYERIVVDQLVRARR
jgi:SAM-dependent methyltransferase